MPENRTILTFLSSFFQQRSEKLERRREGKKCSSNFATGHNFLSRLEALDGSRSELFPVFQNVWDRDVFRSLTVYTSDLGWWKVSLLVAGVGMG